MPRLLLVVLSCVLPACGLFAQDEEPKLTLGQAKAKFEKADKRLNDAWARAKKELSEEDFSALREDQRSWLEWREAIASSPNYSEAPADPDHPGKSAGYYSMAADLADDRVKWIGGLLKQTKSADESMTGHWSDSHNGSLDIVEKDGQIYFVFDVVRGRGANVGALSGVARWHDTIGWFSDKGRDKDATQEANVSFVYKQPRLEVVEAGADSYHGNNARFDGSYVKVTELDAKQQRELIAAAKKGEIPGQ